MTFVTNISYIRVQGMTPPAPPIQPQYHHHLSTLSAVYLFDTLAKHPGLTACCHKRYTLLSTQSMAMMKKVKTILTKVTRRRNQPKTFDWGVLLTQGQCVWTVFCKIYSGTPHLTILGMLKYVPKYGQIRPNTPNTVFGVRIWARQIWSSYHITIH